MNTIVTIETGAVVHHCDLRKVCHIRHEPRSDRATLFLHGGNEVVVVFPSHEDLRRFVQQFRMVNS